MRRFHSYGPVDPDEHFCVSRQALVEKCVAQLVGNPQKGGYYFTIWAPRQTGKTWLMRQAMEEIRARYSEQFSIGALSMQGVMAEDEGEEAFFRVFPSIFREGFGVTIPKVNDWQEWLSQFEKEGGLFQRPTILLIDEFDSLPQVIIDRLVSLFRKAYLSRSAYHLHGLALIGVRAVLGVDSERGSPFNVQRSLQVLNLTEADVDGMFGQYQEESGQVVEPDVRAAVFEATRGQPGLVSWFGELLTEKYNPGLEAQSDPCQQSDATVQNKTTISITTWYRVYAAALDVEPNNTVLNLIAKARSEPYRPHVSKLFATPDLPFSFRKEWCNYLYLNGVISYQEKESEPQGCASGQTTFTCRFSSPFVQQCLFGAFTEDLIGEKLPVRAIDPSDGLDDVYTSGGLDLPRLLKRYQAYLEKLEVQGINPWREHPRRKDLRLTEAVGHFHLYAWLQEAVGRQCVISPEFPTGNGKVDLLIRWQRHLGIIEVKSFTELRDIPKARRQAAHYARKLGLSKATFALFVPVPKESPLLLDLSTLDQLEGVQIATIALTWD